MSRNSPSPWSRALAQQLLASEDASGKPRESNATAVFCVSEKLRRPLSTLAGVSGFRLLLARALTLAKAQDARLGGVQVNQDGSLEGLGGADQEPGAGVLLIAQLLELL